MPSTFLKGDLLTVRQASTLWDAPETPTAEKTYQYTSRALTTSKPITCVFMGYLGSTSKVGYVAIASSMYIVKLESCCFYERKRRKNEKISRSVYQ